MNNSEEIHYMNNVEYKIKSSGFKRLNEQKYYRLETIIKIKYNNENKYNINYEDEDFIIKINTNIKKIVNELKEDTFKAKILDDKSLIFKIDLISNFQYKTKHIKLENCYYKGEFKTDNIFLKVVFKPKSHEVIGKMKMMRYNNKNNFNNPKYYKFSQKTPISKNSYIKFYRGGGCSGK